MASFESKAPVFCKINGEVDPRMHVMEVEHCLGSKGRNSAVLELELTNDGRPELVFYDSIGGVFGYLGRTVEIAFGTPDNVVHVGRIVGGQLVHQQQGEVLQLTSRLDPEMVSQRLMGYQTATWVVDKFDSTQLPTDAFTNSEPQHRDLIFNPEIEGIVYGNMWYTGGLNLYVRDPMSRIRDIETLKELSDPKSKYRAGMRRWPVEHALIFLYNNLVDVGNSRSNRFRIDLDAMPKYLFTKELPTTRVPLGTNLFDAFTMILEPLGLDWTIRFEPNLGIQIHVIDRDDDGVTGKVSVTDDVVDFRFAFDRSDRSASKVRVLGDFYRKEGTFELVPAWDEKYNDYTYTQLKKNSTEWNEDPESRRAWRDWVLNETGEYSLKQSSGVKRFSIGDFFFIEKPVPYFPPNADISAYPHAGSLSRGGFFETSKRRKFMPTLTLRHDGTPIGDIQGVHIEYYDGLEWRPVLAGSSDETQFKGLKDGRSFQLLENECGITWTADTVSPALKGIGLENLKLRVTATLVSDARLSADYERKHRNYFPEVVVRDPERMKWQHLCSEGDYKSVFYDEIQTDTLIANEVDSHNEIRTYARDLGDRYYSPKVKGVITLGGVNASVFSTFVSSPWSRDGLRPGMVVMEINDTIKSGPYIGTKRRLNLSSVETTAESKDATTSPMIERVRWNVNAQTTQMYLESSRGRTV